MRLVGRVALSFAWIAVSASAAPDTVADCRAAHASDPAAHVACLEAALGGERPESASIDVDDVPQMLGAEQVRRAQRTASPDSGPVLVVIVSTAYNARQQGIFRLEDGQVWREIESSPTHQRLAPDRTYAARLERGKLGGYRMYVDGVRRMKKVERLE
jgi:hypothetical protein